MGGRPGRLAHPASRALRVRSLRRDAVLHPHPHHRLVHDTGVGSLQPVVPPADRLLEESDRGARDTQVRVLVAPGTDERAPGHVEVCHEPEDRVRVAVRPSSHRHDGTRDVGVVLVDGGALPVLVAALVLEPLLDPETAALEAFAPHVAPAVPDDGGVWRQAVEREHDGRLGHVVRQQSAAHVVHVVHVQVFRGGRAHDRLERGRAPRGHLQAVESAPGDPHHADIPVAPGLFGKPRDDVLGVLVLLAHVLVDEHPVGISAAAHVDADAHVAVPCHVRVVERVPSSCPVALAVRDVLEHGRQRPGLR